MSEPNGVATLYKLNKVDIMNFLKLFIRWLIVLYCLNGTAHAADINLIWDASVSTNLGGYRIYYGKASNTYTSNVDVGNVISYKITGLDDNIRYYFAVKSYNTDKTLESAGYSNEVSGTGVPIIVPPPTIPPVVVTPPVIDLTIPTSIFTNMAVTTLTGDLFIQSWEVDSKLADGCTYSMDNGPFVNIKLTNRTDLKSFCKMPVKTDGKLHILYYAYTMGNKQGKRTGYSFKSPSCN